MKLRIRLRVALLNLNLHAVDRKETLRGGLILILVVQFRFFPLRLNPSTQILSFLVTHLQFGIKMRFFLLFTITLSFLFSPK